MKWCLAANSPVPIFEYLTTAAVISSGHTMASGLALPPWQLSARKLPCDQLMRSRWPALVNACPAFLPYPCACLHACHVLLNSLHVAGVWLYRWCLQTTLPA
jgi:hypothetical protein